MSLYTDVCVLNCSTVMFFEIFIIHRDKFLLQAIWSLCRNDLRLDTNLFTTCFDQSVHRPQVNNRVAREVVHC
jgi:hypothetical protein